MKTYSCHYRTGGVPLFKNKPASELFNLIPCGAKIINGDGWNSQKKEKISKATYLLPNGLHIILTEDK